MSIPGPMLVGWSGYASLTIPTLDRDQAMQAAGGLLDAARKSGARALFLPGLAVDGAAFAALEQALKQRGLSADTLRSYRRAALDCTGDADATLREALGAKKLKELRRQRHRLEDAGALSVSIATTPQEVAPALETVSCARSQGLERRARHRTDPASGRRGLYPRQPRPRSRRRGRFEIVSLMRNGATIASGLILRDGDRAYFFKIAMDESEARTSPGVQLTLDITRHLCADPNIAFADSSTDSEHPMIDHVWRDADRDRRHIHSPFAARSGRRGPSPARQGAHARHRHRQIHQTDQGETVMTFFEPTDTTALDARLSQICRSGCVTISPNNPLLTLPKLAELVRELPRDRIEYNSGKAVDQPEAGNDADRRSRPGRDRAQDRDRRRLDGAQACRRAPGLSAS